MEDRVAVLDGPERVDDITKLTQVATSGEGEAMNGWRPPKQARGFGAFYYPWITVRDPFEPAKLVNVAPAGHIAGIWARTDATRGVHKAPANEIVRGAVNLSHRLTHQEQGVLNPEGVNVIRFFSQQGIVVWGARTVADGSSEWRYLNVRRLFSMIEESIATSTRWIVFEPNDRKLWNSIRRDITAFLTRVWRDGALMGRTPEEAFFVKCDEETNPPENIDAGIVTTIIGIAPVKPAEFIVFKITQKESGVEVEETTPKEGGS
jgi:phage tail sheath protein FI